MKTTVQKLVAAVEGVNPPIPTHTILHGIRKIRHSFYHACPYMECRWKIYFLSYDTCGVHPGPSRAGTGGSDAAKYVII